MYQIDSAVGKANTDTSQGLLDFGSKLNTDFWEWGETILIGGVHWLVGRLKELR